MLLSIITINYNDKEGLARTMDSVLSQTYTDYEYIVIDGGSDDGSKAVIEQHQDKLGYWVSEPDNGIYNAMNKGIAKAKGDYILFLNSGDYLNDDEVLNSIKLHFNTTLDIYYGNLYLIDAKGDKRFHELPEKLTFEFFFRRTLPHQSAFIKRSLFDTVFMYNEKLKIVSDWEFFICAIFFHQATLGYMNHTICVYDDALGMSSLEENKKLRFKEREKVLRKYFPLLYDDYSDALLNKREVNSILFKKVKLVSSTYFRKKLLLMILNVFQFFIKKNY